MSIPHTVINVFIGWDSREPIAADVCAYSILKHASVPVNIHYLKLDELEREKIITRKRDQSASTEFTYTRFLVPYFMGYQGKAIFCDCDFLWTQDIKELYDQITSNKSVYVVPHEKYGYTPKTKLKMDGKAQSVYPKKNWSSMMAFNCGSLDCQRLSLDVVNQKPLSYLHRFEWVTQEKKIGYLRPIWNWLSGYYEEKDWGKPSAIHYTDGGPWFNDQTLPKEYQKAGIGSWSQVQYGDVWLKYKEEYQEELEQRDKRTLVNISDLTLGKAMTDIVNELEHILLDPYNLYEEKHNVTQLINKIKRYHNKGIIGVSDMADLPQSVIKRGFKWDRVVDAFVKGTGGFISDWDAVLKNMDEQKHPIAFRGITKKYIYDFCKENGRDFYFIDTGYFGNGKTKSWHRVTKNNLQYCSELRDVPADRYIKAHGYTKKFTSGGKILLCPPSEKAMNFYGENLDTWMEKTVAEIKKHTDRPIEIRLKQKRSERVTEQGSIQTALQDDVHCLVTYNSIAAIEALMEGKPAFVLGQNAASPLCSDDLSKLETPLIPTEDEVMYLLSNLAYHQFNHNELTTGRAWEILQEWYSK